MLCTQDEKRTQSHLKEATHSKKRRPETNKIQQQLRRHKIIKLKCTREYKNLIFMGGYKEAGIISAECAIVLMINKECARVCGVVCVCSNNM